MGGVDERMLHCEHPGAAGAAVGNPARVVNPARVFRDLPADPPTFP